MHTFFNRSTQKTCETRGYRTYYYRDKLGSKTGSLSCLFSILCIDITHIKPWQTDLKVDASQRKFAKPEVAYGLAMGGQTDSQVAKSRKFHTETVDPVNYLCRLALGGQAMKNFSCLGPEVANSLSASVSFGKSMSILEFAKSA